MASMTPRELEILKTFHGAFTDANILLAKEGDNLLRFQMIDADGKIICENDDDYPEILFYTKGD